MLSALVPIFRTPDLRRKILVVLGLLVLYRLGATIPSPGVDYKAVSQCLDQLSKGSNADIYSLINMFSGGALLQLSVFAIGIMPYITASIIIQLLNVVIPRFETLSKEGQAGQAKITQYTRYLTVALALLQATAIVALAARGQLLQGCQQEILASKSIFQLVVIVLVMTAGAILVMWMGELITERGVGNGMSLLIFSGIAARLPAEGKNILDSSGSLVFTAVIIAVLVLIAAVVFIEQGQRRIPVQYAKRMVGRRMYGGSSTYLPIKVNTAGVIPVIFASSLLYLPQLVIQLMSGGGELSGWQQWIQTRLVDPKNWVHIVVYFGLIVFFTYFYVAITFKPEERADEMKKFGGFIPGIRPGQPTADYLNYVLQRITFPGSLYLGIIAILPNIFLSGANFSGIAATFGGTSILILVGVGLDTVKQIESQLMQRNYEGFLK
ncbi:preprotein translocase subunit SecY [Tsukamurella sp. 8F]|uniref:preprotein translocase subunit SecY n=1 Tax=unclassified Tsukamurella TaxID=2633480 RepID=UPI0023B99B72|nr:MULTISPECIES: preprotein translocase subunit SecY [unclassified Tsukamurella]MDF0530875.1 preprotein translocase subunit SecY [Tsukamurella sp. 8J]MDF0588180.1 preprotein translocase subunit SecY [Tsukamurella sp. 8F]